MTPLDRGRARRERDERRRVRVDGGGLVDRFGVEQIGEGCGVTRKFAGRCVTDDEPLACCAGQERFVRFEVLEATEPIGGDDDLGLGRADDVREFLRSVEVDDRHDHRADVRRAPEHDAGFDPVRQLEHDDVAWPDPTLAQRRHERHVRRDRCPPSCRATGARPSGRRSCGRRSSRDWRRPSVRWTRPSTIPRRRSARRARSAPFVWAIAGRPHS